VQQRGGVKADVGGGGEREAPGAGSGGRADEGLDLERRAGGNALEVGVARGDATGRGGGAGAAVAKEAALLEGDDVVAGVAGGDAGGAAAVVLAAPARATEIPELLWIGLAGRDVRADALLHALLHGRGSAARQIFGGGDLQREDALGVVVGTTNGVAEGTRSVFGQKQTREMKPHVSCLACKRTNKTTNKSN
jgi:hypothetical protein